MFQKNLGYRHNPTFFTAIKEVGDILLHDEQFVEYVRSQLPEGERERELSDKDLRKGLHNYVEKLTDPALKDKFGKLESFIGKVDFFTNGRLYKIPDARPGTGAPNTADAETVIAEGAWEDIIKDFNELNGYKVEKNFFLKPVDKEVTEKSGQSLGDVVHAAFEKNGYQAVSKNNPEGTLALHLCTVTDKMFAKMAEFEQQTRLANFEVDYMTESGEAKVDEEQSVMNKITSVENKLNFIPDGTSVYDILSDEKLFDKYHTETLAKVKACDEELSKSDDVLRDEILARPETVEQLEAIEKEITEQVKKDIPAEYEEKLTKLREKLEFLAEDARGTNTEIEAENKEIEAENAEINKKIQAVEEDRDQKLAELKVSDPAALEKEMRADWVRARDDYERAIEPTEERRRQLKMRLSELTEGEEAGARIASGKNLPTLEKIRAAEAETAKVDVLGNLTYDLFYIGDRDRGAPYLKGGIPKDAYSKYVTNTDKIEKLRASIEKLSAEMSGMNNEKMQKTAETIKKSNMEINAAVNEIDGLGKIGKAIAAIEKMRKENPELAKEFDNEKKAATKAGTYPKTKSEYNILVEMNEKHEAQLNALKAENPEYYSDVEKLRVAETKTSKNPKIKEELTEQIKECDEKIKSVPYVPTREEFEKQLKEKLDSLPAKEKIEAGRKELIEKADKEIAGLREGLREKEELREVQSKESIDAEVEKERGIEEHVREVKIMGETERRIKEAREKFLANAVKQRRDQVKELRHKFDSDSIEMFTVKRETEVLHKKMEERNRNVLNAHDKWKNMKLTENDKISMISRRLKQFEADVDKGYERGHNNTNSFNRMKNSVAETNQWIEANKTALHSGDPEAIKTLNEKLQLIGDETRNYVAKKQGGIHWKPSNMRFVRLQYADDLTKFSEEAKTMAAEHVAFCKQKNDMGEKVIGFVSKAKFREKFPEYSEYMKECREKYFAPKNVPAGEEIDLAKDVLSNAKQEEIQVPQAVPGSH